MIEHDVECDHCGEKKKDVASTSRGCLCLDCIELYQTELRKAIKEISLANKSGKQTLNDKSKANEALIKMAGGLFDVTGKSIEIE